MWNGISIVKNDENQDELKNLIWKIIYIGKISMHLTIKLLILWCPIWYYYDIFFESTFFFFVCDKHSVIISKVHNESILFLKLIHNF
jgi:hypothetical protein